MLSNRQIGILWVLLAALGYAFLPIFTRFIYQFSDLQPTDVALWRFIFATPAIWLIVYINRNSKRQQNLKPDEPKQVLRMFALGLLYATSALTVFFGLQYIEASLYIIIFYTYPAMVAIINVFLGEKLRPIAWLALALTLTGVILTVPDLSLAGDDVILGLGIALLNALSVAVYFVIVSREMPKVSSVMRGTAYVITGTLIVLLFTLPFFGLQLPPTPLVFAMLLGMGTLSTAMPIFVINLGIERIGVTQASIIITIEPLMTLVLAVSLLGEIILPVQWLGAAFIIAGVIILEIRPKEKRVPA
ncbi:MAG: DMT family transporter [Chloroflexota bacterium]